MECEKRRVYYIEEYFLGITVNLKSDVFINCKFKNCLILNADHNEGEDMKLYDCCFENCYLVNTVYFSDLSIQHPTVFINCNTRLVGDVEQFFEHDCTSPNLTKEDKKDIEAFFNNCFINDIPTYKFLDEYNFTSITGHNRPSLP